MPPSVNIALHLCLIVDSAISWMIVNQMTLKMLILNLVISTLVQELCREEEVEFVDLCGCFVGKAYMYMRDGLHLSGKGAAVFANELSAAIVSGMGSIKNNDGSKHCLN